MVTSFDPLIVDAILQALGVSPSGERLILAVLNRYVREGSPHVSYPDREMGLVFDSGRQRDVNSKKAGVRRARERLFRGQRYPVFRAAVGGDPKSFSVNYDLRQFLELYERVHESIDTSDPKEIAVIVEEHLDRMSAEFGWVRLEPPPPRGRPGRRPDYQARLATVAKAVAKNILEQVEGSPEEVSLRVAAEFRDLLLQFLRPAAVGGPPADRKTETDTPGDGAQAAGQRDIPVIFGDPWVCTNCGMRGPSGPDWRYNGEAYEHKCPGLDPQAGYFLTVQYKLRNPDADYEVVPFENVLGPVMPLE
jgi:hypothetical protein